jgi:tight adherence protein B
MVLEVSIAVFVFIAVTSLCVTVLGQVPLARPAEQRLGALRLLIPKAQEQDPADILKGRASSLPPLRALLAHSKWSKKAAIDLERAGLSLRVGEYLLVRLIVAVITGLFGLVVAGSGGFGLLFALAVGGIGFMLPAWYLARRRRRRAAAISHQLIEMLQLVSSALRSGFAFTQAVETAAKQLTPPILDEVNHFLRDTALGRSMEESLNAMTERVESYDLDIAATAILVQSTTGGNLAEILSNVADTLRERERIRGEIRSLTAHQRFTAQVLSVYPVALAVIFFALNPSLMSVMWTERLGQVILAIGVGLQLIGAFAIPRILSVDV